jgi:hypothetical protein
VRNKIKHLDDVGENYQVALDILFKKHSQPIGITTNLIDHIFSNPKLIQMKYDSMLRAMYIKFFATEMLYSEKNEGRRNDKNN